MTMAITGCAGFVQMVDIRRRLSDPPNRSAMMANDRRDWTPEELLAELRARERARVAAAPEGGPAVAEKRGAEPATRKAAPTGVVARFRKLDEVSSAELATTAIALQRAIYGVDDRKDIYAVSNKRAIPLIESSLALVESSDLQRTPDGKWSLRTSSYKAAYQLCSSEPFVSQPLGCFCSGVLVAPDVVATAGHCVKSTEDLAHIRFVFGFRMLNADNPRTTFSDDDVYRGLELIDRKYTLDRTDWALVRLDRPVTGREPVSFRKAGKVEDDEPVFVVGHPCGLPQKMAGGARVRNNTPESHFIANLDTYGGNSGSPVFSAKTYELEGLLVRGQKDFISTGSCYISLVYPTTGSSGEDIARSTEFAKLVDGKSSATRRKPARRTVRSSKTRPPASRSKSSRKTR
jgi:V8-like Glu-specific endopeptidase